MAYAFETQVDRWDTEPDIWDDFDPEPVEDEDDGLDDLIAESDAISEGFDA